MLAASSLWELKRSWVPPTDVVLAAAPPELPPACEDTLPLVPAAALLPYVEVGAEIMF